MVEHNKTAKLIAGVQFEPKEAAFAAWCDTLAALDSLEEPGSHLSRIALPRIAWREVGSTAAPIGFSEQAWKAKAGTIP
jgi:hypothetical protein